MFRCAVDEIAFCCKEFVDKDEIGKDGGSLEYVAYDEENDYGEMLLKKAKLDSM